MNNKLINFVEESFLKPILKDNKVTDITYNGVGIFYVHNDKGRQKSNIKVTNNDALDFIRQIANLSEKQFSYSVPHLDVSFGKYRLEAVHQSIVRVGDDKSCSFALRIGSIKNRIQNDKKFISAKALTFLLNAMDKEESLVIAGPTGSGKTELQKFLLSKLKKNTRIIVIDNIQELENLRVNDDLDLTSWQILDNNQFGSIQQLIKVALRSNPDWLVISESRGEEMNDILNSVLTGHPIITTIHAKSIEEIPKRICRMIEMANINQKHEDVMEDVVSTFKTYVFLNRNYLNGNVERYVESIGRIREDGSLDIIYKKGEKNE